MALWPESGHKAMLFFSTYNVFDDHLGLVSNSLLNVRQFKQWIRQNIARTINYAVRVFVMVHYTVETDRHPRRPIRNTCWKSR